MFGSKTDEATVIGRGAVIEGTIRARGRVQVDGRIDGKLEVAGVLSVGPEGRIHGEVIADEIAVGGEVDGKLTARKHLQIVRTGKVRGEVHYETLQVDRGAVLDGRTLHGQHDAAAATAKPSDAKADAVESLATSEAQAVLEIEVAAESIDGKPAAPPVPPKRKSPSRASQAPSPIGAS